MATSRSTLGQTFDVVRNWGRPLYNDMSYLAHNTSFGRGFVQGVGETFGWEFGPSKAGGVESKGIFGVKDTKAYSDYVNARKGGIARTEAMRVGIRSGANAFKQAGTLGSAKMIGLKAIAPAFAVMAGYQGYKEGGVLGAAKGVAGSAIEYGLMKGAMAVVGSAGAAVTIAGVALGAAAYQFQKQARQYGKQMRKLEMGSPIEDPFGTVATSRQRSLMALQNTHLNGRMAMGNEGMLMHSSHYRR